MTLGFNPEAHFFMKTLFARTARYATEPVQCRPWPASQARAPKMNARNASLTSAEQWAAPQVKVHRGFLIKKGISAYSACIFSYE